MLAPHLDFNGFFSKYLLEKLTPSGQRLLGFCEHSTQRGFRQVKFLQQSSISDELVSCSCRIWKDDLDVLAVVAKDELKLRPGACTGFRTVKFFERLLYGDLQLVGW